MVLELYCFLRGNCVVGRKANETAAKPYDKKPYNLKELWLYAIN